MTPPFPMRFRSCFFIWELFPCACFLIYCMQSLYCDLTYTRLMFVDSSLSHHNIAVEGCLFHLRWRDCCVNCNIPFKQRFEWGGSVHPQKMQCSVVADKTFMKKLILWEILTFSQSQSSSTYVLFHCKEERRGRSFDIPELFIHGWCTFNLDQIHKGTTQCQHNFLF